MTAADLTADLVLIADTSDGAFVLLVQRSQDSDAYPGHWALPGGYLDDGETFRQAAARECAEETGVTVSGGDLAFVGVYDAPDRDPRGRVVSGAFGAVLPERVTAEGRDDADRAEWVRIVPALARELAFDHRQVLDDALINLGVIDPSPTDRVVTGHTTGIVSGGAVSDCTVNIRRP